MTSQPSNVHFEDTIHFNDENQSSFLPFSRHMIHHHHGTVFGLSSDVSQYQHHDSEHVHALPWWTPEACSCSLEESFSDVVVVRFILRTTLQFGCGCQIVVPSSPCSSTSHILRPQDRPPTSSRLSNRLHDWRNASHTQQTHMSDTGLELHRRTVGTTQVTLPKMAAHGQFHQSGTLSTTPVSRLGGHCLCRRGLDVLQ
jgi:hypothetical protein